MNERHLPLHARYFALTALLTLPTYAVFVSIGLGALPKEVGLGLISVAPLAPLLAALGVTAPDERRALLKRALDWDLASHWGWFMASVFGVPAMLLLALLLLSMTGVPVPNADAPLFLVPVLFAVFMPVAAAEELGWMGVGYPSLVGKVGRLKAAGILALVWVLWHLPFYLVMFSGPTAILAHCTTIAALRFAMVWLYETSGRSVFLMTLMHATFNVSLVVIPVYGMGEPQGIVAVAFVMLALSGGLWLWDVNEDSQRTAPT